MTPGTLRCAVLDRDGTLIRHVPYLRDPAQVELLPSVADGIRALRGAGRLLFLHTNQSGISRNLFSEADAMACNQAMIEQIGLGADVFERICIAPEAPWEAPVYRKPSPRFGQELMSDFGFAADDICYIGDNIGDLQTAEALGCEGVGVDTGGHDLRALIRTQGFAREYAVFDNFKDAVSHVIGSPERK